MRAAAMLAATAALAGCSPAAAESVDACADRFAPIVKRLPVKPRIAAVVYTYNISAMSEDPRGALMKNGIGDSGPPIITFTTGAGQQDAERRFMDEPMTRTPRMLIANRWLFRVRQAGRGNADAMIRHGCEQLGQGARMIYVSTWFGPA